MEIIKEQTVQTKTEFYQPAEWDQHESCWLAWPSHGELWQENLEPAQTEFIAFCEAICDLDPVTKIARGEKLNILVPHETVKAQAAELLKHLPVTFHEIPFGDIWLRDTAPIFLKNLNNEKSTVSFSFNGWGGKYILPHDADVASRIAKTVGYKKYSFDWVLEGGSVEVDGQGTCLVTKQCLLNPNRNLNLSIPQIEKILIMTLGVKKVLWLDKGLINDHTDGHIDTLARFCRSGKVLCMQAATMDDPNFDSLKQIENDLRQMEDAQGRPLEVVTIPSPGLILDENDRVMPASYLNFYISNTCIIVPTYGSSQDQKAVAAIAECFPERKTIGLSAKAILSGGGAFHCITQQEPK